eukprot:m.78922 g.78922  ORF g.78922 m.78922 type:complete len:749 (+) comp9257_c0_seq2:202-2448(+)
MTDTAEPDVVDAFGEDAGGMADALDQQPPGQFGRRMSMETLPSEFVSHVVAGTSSGARQSRPSIVSQSDVSLKSAWIERRLKARESEFTRNDEVTVCAATFNVNGRKPYDDDGEELSMASWLADELPVESPDVYAIGFQELDLSKEAFLLNNSSHEAIWTSPIETALAARGTYAKLLSKQLVGILLMIYIKTDLLPHVEGLVSASEGTGILGMMGNKGGVSIRFKLYNSTFCFVCSHLAAHNKNVKRRNKDWDDIMNNTVLALPSGRELSILDHDNVIFVGDLNYRIPDLSLFAVLDCLKVGSLESLLKIEQLAVERLAGNVFIGFDEAPITFWPTYKFDPGTDEYEMKKLRTPSWTDRVLYRGANIANLEYTSRPGIQLSDHKPVRCVLNVGVSVVDTAKYTEILQIVHRELDTMENLSMPDAKVSTNNVDLGTLRYGQVCTVPITLTNIGKVMTQFRFVPKPDDDLAMPPWLVVSPAAGILAPGESAELVFHAKVDYRTVGPLNRGEMHVDDIVVLHLENGKDIFVSIMGKWESSFMGTSLDELVDRGPGVEHDRVPRQLWAMIDHLNTFGLGDPNLFLDTGGSTEEVVRHLDEGQQIPPDCDVFEVATVLIEFLKALPESVIPSSYVKDCVEHATSLAASRRILFEVEPVRQQTFLYIIAFLRHTVVHSGTDSMDAEAERHRDELRERLALVFGKLLLRSPTVTGSDGGDDRPLTKADLVIAKRQALFIDNFLSNDDTATEDTKL